MSQSLEYHKLPTPGKVGTAITKKMQTAEDLALATYVCPSKYDYCSILMDNLNKVYEEL